MDLIKEKGIVVSDKEIILSSGEKTHFYYDVKKVALDPKGANLIGELLLDEVKKLGAKSVGGLEIGAIPITTAILMKSDRKNELTGFLVRKKAKGHGLENIIEGDLVEPAVIVEDVVTKGASVNEAIKAVNKKRVNVAGVVSIVDREANQLKQTIRYHSLFTHSDFKLFIEARMKKRPLLT